MEVSRTPMNLRYYAGEAMRTAGVTFPTGDGSLVFTLRAPVGVVAAITPWNFPLNIPSRKLGPALAAGNGVVFKPSEVTPLLGQRLVDALLEGGLPAARSPSCTAARRWRVALVTDDRVDAVTFTGSTNVGEAIHRARGPASAPSSRWAARTLWSCRGRRPRPGGRPDRQGRVRALRPGLHRHRARRRPRLRARRPRRPDRRRRARWSAPASPPAWTWARRPPRPARLVPGFVTRRTPVPTS